MNHFPYQFSSPKVNNYENLVLAGGGNKGIAYFGALRYFAQKNQSFKRSKFQKNCRYFCRCNHCWPYGSWILRG